jgi:thiol-disulfide isomerase/thioredoxin
MSNQAKTIRGVGIFLAVLAVTVSLTMSDRVGADEKEAATLREIVAARKTWNLAFQPWYGKAAPDFEVTDITGKKYKLSKLKGKDVLLVFWATWCGPCNREVPHLIELKKMYDKDKDNDLVILAISNEDARRLQDFVAAKKINYPVVSFKGRPLPEPFGKVRSIPTAFYISKQGKVKLATVGMVSLRKMRSIIHAQ